MKEYTLSVILLTRTLMMASCHHSHGENLEPGPGGEEAGQGSRSPEPQASARSVVAAVVSVMAHAHQFPSALAKCILPAVER